MLIQKQLQNEKNLALQWFQPIKEKNAFTYNQDVNRYDQYTAALNVRGSSEQEPANLGAELALDYNLTSGAFSFFHSYCIYTFPLTTRLKRIN